MGQKDSGEGRPIKPGWRRSKTSLGRDLVLLWLALCLLLSACATGRKRTLFEMSDEELLAYGRNAYEKKRYEEAREALSRVTSEPYRAEALLLRGATYFDQKGLVNIIQALPLYKNFVLFYPRHEKVPLVLYRIGQIYFMQYEASDRDLTQTDQALDEFERIVKRFPGSPYADMAQERILECRRRFAEHEFLVGKFYLKRRSYEGAWERFQNILTQYNGILESPELFFYLVRTAWWLERFEEAQAYFLELRSRYPDSKYVGKARSVLEKKPGRKKGS